MNDTDRIWHKYIDGLNFIGYDSQAIRLALRLALQELAVSVEPTAPAPQSDEWLSHVMRLTEYLFVADATISPEMAVDRAIDLLRQNAAKVVSAEILLEWLENNGYADHNPYGADTAIELIESQREEISRMTLELEQLRGQYKPERFADLANLLTRARLLDSEQGVMETAIVALQSQRDEISRLREELAVVRQLHTGNGAGLRVDVAEPTVAATATGYPTPILTAEEAEAQMADLQAEIIARREAAVAPVPSAKNEDVSTGWMERFQARFADDQPMLDWLDGIAAGRNLFRQLPRDVRWKLVQAVINDIRPRNGRQLTQTAFDAAKPEWMSTAAAASITFGGGKWDHVVLVAVQS